MPASRARKAKRAQQPETGMGQPRRPNGGAPAILQNPTYMQALNTAESMRLLRDFPAFNQIMALLQQMTIASLKLLEDNEDPAKDVQFKMQWKAFKAAYTTINYYMEGVIQQRREAVMEILYDLGFDDEFVARHQDMSFAPLMPLNPYPQAPAPAQSAFAGASEEQ